MNAQAEKIRALNGNQWRDVVGEIWDSKASVFSTPWEQLSHHDQVAVYRLLSSPALDNELGTSSATSPKRSLV